MPKTKKGSLVKRALKGVFLILLAAFVLQLAYLLCLKWIDPPLTITQFKAVLDGHTFERDYVELEEISPQLRLAVIAAEDQKFSTHNGFDWESIEKAVKHNRKGAGSLRGASTISQQTAKNVFLWQGRTWLRKGLETYLTAMIENMWSKRRILEVYLNVAEMGPGVFGAQAAAAHYYGIDAKDLGAHQAAALAAILPNPKAYNPKKPGYKLQRKIAWVREQMKILKQNNNIKPLLEN